MQFADRVERTIGPGFRSQSPCAGSRYCWGRRAGIEATGQSGNCDPPDLRPLNTDGSEPGMSKQLTPKKRAPHREAFSRDYTRSCVWLEHIFTSGRLFSRAAKAVLGGKSLNSRERKGNLCGRFMGFGAIRLKRNRSVTHKRSGCRQSRPAWKAFLPRHHDEGTGGPTRT